MPCLVVSVLSLLFSRLAGAQDYVWTEIVIPGGVLQSWGVNDRCQVGDFTTIDVPGALRTSAFGINARGDIAGGYTDTSGELHGYLLSREEQDEDDNETIE